MQNATQHNSNAESNTQPPGNHDGSDKNYGGYDENGKPINQTEERFPGNSSNPGDKSNYDANHGEAQQDTAVDEDTNDNDDLSRASRDSSINLAQDAEFEDDDAEDLESDVEFDDTKSNGGTKEEKGHTKPPGDPAIPNRGASDGEVRKS